MTDRKFYRKTFSQVHSARPIEWEDMKKMKRKKRVSRTLVLLAAALCALTLGAAAVNIFGLEDLVLPKEMTTPEGESGASPIPADSPDLISLSGYMGAPESQALGEWQTFLDGYDKDKSILRSVGNEPDPALNRYFHYYVYTKEMGDKLDEICAKYGLKLHTERIDLTAHPEALAACEGYAGPNVRAYPMYMYEDGTFAFDGEAVTGCGILDIQFRRSVKGTFQEVTLNIMDAARFDQWNYETESGAAVLLALGPSKGLVLADLPDCFVTVNVLMGTDQGVTGADLEELADSFDYTRLSPAVPPVVEPEATPAPVEGTARSYFVKALKDFYYDGLLPNGTQTEEYGSGPISDRNQFAVQDVDGDGEEELIVLYTTTYTAGQTGLVMAFDPDFTGYGAPLREELAGFPLFTFYGSGAVEVGWSHNQGLAGDSLWPYDLYVYDRVLDTYGNFASVDAWDKSLSETSWSDGSPFPEEVDADGDGIVYYVRPAGTYGSIEPVDGPIYQAWREAVVGNISPMGIEFQPLDIEHINALLEEG